MCWTPVAAGLQIAGTLLEQREAEKNAKAARTAAIHQMNLSFQNYEMERQDAFDSAVQEITNTRLSAGELNASVDAAVNEDMAGGGRTANLIKRNARGAEARNVASVQDNYQRKSNEIDLNKEATLIGSKSKVNSIKAPSRIGAALQIASTVAGVKTSMDKAAATAKSQGTEWDYWLGKANKKNPIFTLDPVTVTAKKK